VLEVSPPIVIGEETPFTVMLPGLEVTKYKDAAGEPPGSEKETEAAALLNALPVPTSVADTLTGADGCKKSFCC
jgi:hypothetical protein